MTFSSYAQTVENKNSEVPIYPYVPQQVENMPLSARNLLESRMAQILSKDRMAASKGFNSRFIMVPNVSVLSKDLVSSAPPKIALTLDIAFIIGDGLTGTKFGSTAITVKGVGTNENKAYISAIKNIKRDNDDLKRLILSSSARIVSYYENNCETLLKEAETLSEQNRYSEALNTLYGVPQNANSCFNSSREMIVKVFEKESSFVCDYNLNKAKAIWNANKTTSSASEAAFYLGLIGANKNCSDEKQSLIKEMSNSIEEANDREWKYEQEEQKARLQYKERELELYQAITLEYLKNQPQTIYNIRGW
jgi:hypothetical protein